MIPTAVTVLFVTAGPFATDDPESAAVVDSLKAAGYAPTVSVIRHGDYGDGLRSAVAQCSGSLLAVIDGCIQSEVHRIVEAVRKVEREDAHIVFCRGSGAGGVLRIVRALLVERAPDPAAPLAVFSIDAARAVVRETRLRNRTCDLEIAYLANKYGFRVEQVTTASAGRMRTYGVVSALVAVIRIRRLARRNAYRPARRCPVCFSAEVWTIGQIPQRVVRACRRCKCRYLEPHEEPPEPRVFGCPARAFVAPTAPMRPGAPQVQRARQLTARRRLALVRRFAIPRGRLLEIGVRDDAFARAASDEFEYVGLDPSPFRVRRARSAGADVYCGNLAAFVNTGPAFDAAAMFYSIEDLQDPHDALSRLKDLLKPGALLFLTTTDTEGILYLATARRRMANDFRKHRILYSRAALIELLERSGFEIVEVSPDLIYRPHRALTSGRAMHPWVRTAWKRLLGVFPDPVLTISGGIRIVARRRAGSPMNSRAIQLSEATHAR